MREISLPCLKPGQRGTVISIDREAPLADRLIGLGFFPGSSVQRLYSDRSEHLCAYAAADGCIALRREDASCVRVEAQ